MSILIEDNQYNELECETRKDVTRIINYCLSKSWWFYVRNIEGRPHICISHGVDLKKLRDRFPGIKFELA